MSHSYVHDAVFTWPSTSPSEVILTGTFDGWSRSVQLTKGPSGFTGIVKLPWDQSRVAYKYLIDGRWDLRWDQPYERDRAGNINNVYTLPPRPDPPPAEVRKQEEPNESSSKVEEVNVYEKVDTSKDERSKFQDGKEENIKEVLDVPPMKLLETDKPALSSTGPEPAVAIPEVSVPAVSSTDVELAPEVAMNDHPEAVSSVLDTISKSEEIPASGLGTEPGLEMSSENAAILESLDKAAVPHFEKKEDAEDGKIEHVRSSNTSNQNAPRKEFASQTENLPDGVELSQILPTKQAQAVLSEEASAAPVIPPGASKALEVPESEKSTIVLPSGNDSAPPAETTENMTSEPGSCYAKGTQPETALANAASSEVSSHVPLGGAHTPKGINSGAQEGTHAKNVTGATAASFDPESDGETLTDSKSLSTPPAVAATAAAAGSNSAPESAPGVSATTGVTLPSTGNVLTNESDSPTNLKAESPPALEPKFPNGKPEPEQKSSAPSPPLLVSTTQSAPSTPSKSNNTQRFPTFGSPNWRRSTSSSTTGHDSGTVGSQRKKRRSFMGKLKHLLHIDEESKKEKAERKEKNHRESSAGGASSP